LNHIVAKQKKRRRNKMIPDTSTREKSTLKQCHTLLCEAGATHSARTTCAQAAQVTKRTWILACLALGFAFSVVTAVLERVLPHRGPPTATPVGDRKTLRRFPYVAVVSLAAGLVACGGAPSHQTSTSQPSASSTRSPALLKLTSSLDGQTALPLRTQWIATPEPADAVVAKVDFLIDGKLIWIEDRAPYVFGRDGGYLITTWLAPGPHTFTARATAVAGGSVTDTVMATVHAAPQPPASLRGVWTRTVTDEDIAKSGADPSGLPPAGQWKLIFDQVGAWHLDPNGSGIGNQYDVHGNTINVYAPIQMAPLIEGQPTFSRYGHHDLGGYDCNASGPFGSYHWSISGGKLTLTPIHEGCPNRRAVWDGTWTLLTSRTPSP
jgi:hypothetical protein